MEKVTKPIVLNETFSEKIGVINEQLSSIAQSCKTISADVPKVTTGTSGGGSTTITIINKDGTTTTELVDGTARASVDSLSNSVSTRMSAIETEQSVQSARMDTFTSLPEGSTSGNAELADIRVGADGTTYDTAGNAVRGQIGELKSDLEDLESHIHLSKASVNLFDSQNPNEVNLVPKSGGTTIISYSGATSIWIKVKPNSTVTLDNKNSGDRCQAFTFNDVPKSGDSFVKSAVGGNYGKSISITVGETDVYILFYLSTTTCDYSTIRIFYGKKWVDETTSDVSKNTNDIGALKERILNTIGNDNVFNLISYRPLGILRKPYIAFSCDDGASELATITIPRFKGYKTTYSKNIPLTMALMNDSVVLRNDTQKALVQEMISDYGCDVAVHGSYSYTTYTNDDLIDFLNTQDEQLTSLCGKKPVACIYPNHAYDLQKSVIAGSYYGVCAGGYSNGIKYGQSCGARSNMYELHRWSLFAQNTTEGSIRSIIDYACENNLLLMPWFHDYEMTGDNAERNMGLLDYCVQYAESIGMNFISYGEIKSII